LESERQPIDINIRVRTNRTSTAGLKKLKTVDILEHNTNKGTVQAVKNIKSEAKERSKLSIKTKIIKFANRVVDNYFFIGFMTSWTIVALFFSDIEAAFCPREVDKSFDTVQTFLLFIFTFEVILTAVAKKDYLWSFFFWLDVISTISLIEDVSWMFNPIIGISEE
jgi:hypothetical protein